MKNLTLLLLWLFLFLAMETKAQTTCDSIQMDTVFVDGTTLQLTVFNQSQRFIVYPYFTVRLDENPYILMIDSLVVPSFLSIAGDFNNGYTPATYHNITVTQPELIPLNTLFTGTLIIRDPNDSTFYCSKAFSFEYGEMLTSAHDLRTDWFQLYPNPTNGFFTILSPVEKTDIIITDEQGRVVLNMTSHEKESHLVLPSAGVYIVNMRSSSGATTQRLIVMRP